jgi:hypothetical protein
LVDAKHLGGKLAPVCQTQAWQALETFASKHLRLSHFGRFALPLA